MTSGGKDLALRLEDEGYGPILRENGMDINVPDEALPSPVSPRAAPAGDAGSHCQRERAPHDHRDAPGPDPARPGRAAGRLPDP